METLDKHFRQLTQSVFQKHGFAQQDIVSHWPQIVGEGMASCCCPERIRWPRSSSDSAGERVAGGTLHLKAAAGRGLEVQHAVPLILERINQFLGYQAITAVKVVQGYEPAPGRTAKKPAKPLPLKSIPEIDDPDLQAALQRLGAGVAASSPRSPQAK